MSAVIQEISPGIKPEPDYPEPLSIATTNPATAYPLDSLSGLLRNAVIEVQDYVQAPIPLIACNALAAASLATQGLAKIRRDLQLVSPLSLYLLIISDPNERKSFAEGYFVQPIKRWMREQTKANQKEWDQYTADMDMWESQRRGIKLEVQKLAKDSAEAHELEAKANELRQLMENKPAKPLIPKALYGDATHQALLAGLMSYPSAGIMTSEGGAFFGGAGFHNDSTMAAFAAFNELWSDNEIDITRKGEGSTLVRGAALMLNVAVQPEVLRKFFSKTGGLAHGSGFMARVLLTMPESTQGHRPYKDSPADFPALLMLNDRIKELLDQLPEHIDENGRLKRVSLNLSESAKQVWVRYYNQTEAEQRSGGDAEFIRNEAGKSADNASRIAAILHVLEKGLDGDVSREHMEMGANIAQWHLEESKRFMMTSDMPVQFQQAQAASERIAAYCRIQQAKGNNDWNIITKRELHRLQIPGIDKAAELNPIIDELLEAQHLLNRENIGSSQRLTVNPRILELS